MAKIKKLLAKELKEVKELQGEINNLLMNIGNAELVKNQLVVKHADLQNKWNDVTVTLEKKYGAVNISLEDGSLTPVDTEKTIKKV
tara:strand:+ start:670 stop:927 length:258 start_codon:yes stop_codon:yes gene_type:complete